MVPLSQSQCKSELDRLQQFSLLKNDDGDFCNEYDLLQNEFSIIPVTITEMEM